ncbi:phytoene desaturase [Tilletiaria anomala UBC 951]|uniref:Phytoene desaturase n=1 Tax=Tilletiaria anomala (strain ATCC 24038 / CBS 436.72 / UBC 951) TaxID=1037660 RepID=A0A066WEW3_TILAU|nr:phytoene desaturase [Tilletiaria anomala UBC 951]KDN52487.1 phytoene desaturase [Tilletiaria anomala UBC 951]
MAARLGKLGYKVTVFEKNEFSGGRCSLIHANGHRWDQGPSLYLMPELFERAFKDLGEDVKNHYALHTCNPTYNIHFADGEKFTLTPNLAEMGPQLERLERPEGVNDPLGNFIKFLKEAGEHYEESIEHVLLKDWSVSPLSLLRIELLLMLWRTKALRVYRSLYGRASNFFRSSHVRQAMTFSSMFMGISPFRAPATYSLLQYAENSKGVLYPIGGFHKVVESLEKIANKKFGVEFRYNAGVKKVLPNLQCPGRVLGVELDSGEEVKADLVVCNADLVWAYNNLLPESSYSQGLRKLEQTCSSFSFYWALKETVLELSGHNIFLADQYQESFDEIFDKGELPSQPSFYVNVPSRLDPTAAPPGKDTLVVLVPCGLLRADNTPGVADTHEELERLKERARRQIIEAISKRLNRPDFESLIEHEIVNDPFTWKEKFNLFRGSILGLSHSIMQVLYFRPSTQHSYYRNLFFVGASTQPGTGVPVVVAGTEVIAKKADRFLRGYDTSYTKEYIAILILLSMFSWLVVWIFNLTPKTFDKEGLVRAVAAEAAKSTSAL